jgi:D-alanyl-lipoteichoic acid acyltransferase DltB (MBOAT superfamily)
MVTAAIWWLGLVSAVFYAAWDWRFLPMLIISISFNFSVAKLIINRNSLPLLLAAIAANLALLGWFKYAGLFVGTINSVSGESIAVPDLILPLGISFFTFQQISYLIECRNGKILEHSAVDYFAFVTFFPQLIAGPIVRPDELLYRFARRDLSPASSEMISSGAALVIVGLVKKVLVADQFALYANPVFAHASLGTPLSALEAWFGTLAFSFQIYFDFSAYSDMAIGLGLMFGIFLPINFASPYKAANISAFWRSWHITLTKFLRDYLYFPLGGNRKGLSRTGANVIIVMGLGGLWHGAAWTFVAWGLLHGAYLAIYHLWERTGIRLAGNNPWPGRLLTFFCVTIAWVLFRADSWSSAGGILTSMTGLNGMVLPLLQPEIGRELTVSLVNRWAIIWIGTGLFIVWFLPNSQDWLLNGETITKRFAKLSRLLIWKPNLLWGLCFAGLFLAVTLRMSKTNEFLYFQF